MKNNNKLIAQFMGYKLMNKKFQFKNYNSSNEYNWENTEGKIAVGTIENFSLQKKKAEELEYKAHYDSLTNLPNRDFLMEKLYYEIRKYKAKKGIIGILFIDIDNFKQINDTYGHNVGDKVLKIFTEKLKSNIKKTDFLSRYAGDEFILLVSNIIYMVL